MYTNNVTKLTLILFFLALIVGFAYGGGDEPVSNLDVDDNKPSTETSYGVDIAFLGSNLSIKDGTSAHTFNLTTITDNLMEKVSGDKDFQTDNTFSEGRYISWNESSGSKTEVDLVSNSSDVVGRINSSTSFSKTEVTVKVYRWLNSSEIDASQTNEFNSSQVEDWNSSSEKLFRFNTSKDKYWIGLDVDGYAESVNPSKGAPKNRETGLPDGVKTPRINDFQLSPGSNVTGYVKNTTGDSLGDIEVRIRSMSCQAPRTPYLTCPPTKTTTTDSNGYYEFTQLPTERFKLDIINKTHTKDKELSFFQDVTIQIPGSSISENITATDKVGNLTGSMDKISGNRYGLLAENRTKNRTIIATGLNSDFSVKLPEGTYDVMVAKFGSGSGENFNLQTIGNVEVQDGSETKNYDVEFPDQAYFNGTVEDEEGNPVPDARVLMRNQTDRKYESGRTDSNGEFEIRVDKETGYQIRVEPPYESSLTTNTSTVETNSSTLSQLNNYTLTGGATLIGTVKQQSNEEPVTDSYISIENASEGTYKSARTNSSGEYEVEGLKNGKSYDVDIYPAEPGIGEKHSSVQINERQEQKNFTVSEQSTSLTVEVQNSTGSDLDATVEVSNREGFEQEKEATGSVTFNELNQNQFYRVRVEPDSTNYERERDFLSISESSDTVTYKLDKITGLTGYVKNGNGPVEGAFVQARNESERSFGWSRTDSDGFYSLDIKEVSHEVTVYPPLDSSLQSNATEINTSEIQSEEQNFTLSTGNKFEVTINAAGITPKGRIAVWNETARSFAYKEFNSGDFNLTGLKLEDHNIWIDLDSEKYGTKNTEVNSTDIDDGKTFQFGKKQGRKLRINVTNQNTGGELENISVSTKQNENETNSDGTAILPRQEKGKNISISVNGEGYKGEILNRVTKSRNGSSRLGTKIKEFQDVTVDLQPITNLEAKINVTDGGSNVEQASVVFTSNETNVSQTSSDVTGGNGEATLEGLAQGDYLVTLALGENEIYRNTTSISNGDVKTLGMGSGKYDLWYEVSEE